MIRHPLPYYLDGRLYEWAMASSTMLLGVAMLTWPKMMNGSILQVLLQFVDATVAAFIFLSIGILSVIALLANGSSMRMGPRIRSFCAIVRSILWAQFTLSMAEVSVKQGFPSPMVFFFSIFTIAEIYISYRAVLDVRGT